MKQNYLFIGLLVLTGLIMMGSNLPVHQAYTEYRVIEECDSSQGIAKLQESVGSMMKNGWQPVGGVQLYYSYTICYYQSMAR